MSTEDWIKQYEKEHGPMTETQKTMSSEIKNLLNKANQKYTKTTVLDFDTNKAFDQAFANAVKTISGSWSMQMQDAFAKFLGSTKQKNSAPVMTEI